jgi:hypothetical protein
LRPYMAVDDGRCVSYPMSRILVELHLQGSDMVDG